MYELNTDNLTGKCLISSPFMQDEHFHKTVVYICSHGKDGAMGFIINQQIEDISFADLASQLPIGQFNNTRDFNLYNGGPLEKIRGFVIHSTDYIKGDTIVVDKQIAVSSNQIAGGFIQAYVRLLSVSNDKGVKARVELDVKGKTGAVTR